MAEVIHNTSAMDEHEQNHEQEQTRHRPPQPSTKGLQAGLLYSQMQSAASSPSSSTENLSLLTPRNRSIDRPPSPRRRRWNRFCSRLRYGFDADWMWAGFISAGDTTPIGRGGTGAEDGESEQLPAYSEEDSRVCRQDLEARREGSEEWVIEPPPIRSPWETEEGEQPPPGYR